MPYSKRKKARYDMQRRKAHTEYVRSLEGRVVQQDADIALLHAMLGQADEGFWPPSEHQQAMEALRLQEARTQKVEEGLARLEEKAEKAAVLIAQLRAENTALKADLTVERARSTQLEADMARIEVMMDSMLREGDLS